jgi:hypothetical protein
MTREAIAPAMRAALRDRPYPARHVVRRTVNDDAARHLCAGRIYSAALIQPSAACDEAVMHIRIAPHFQAQSVAILGWTP